MSDADRAIGSGLAGDGRFPGPDGAEALFEAMQGRLDELMKMPVVRNDAMARGLLEDMARTDALEDVLPLLDRLDARVRLLLRREGREAPAAPSRERAPRTLLRL